MALFSKNPIQGSFPKAMTSTQLTLVIASLFVFFYNTAFFKSLLHVSAITDVKSFLFDASLAVLVGVLTTLLLSIVVLPRIAKPIIIFLLVAGACASYFMNAYGIVIHQTMIQNAVETDAKEVSALLNSTLALYVIFLGVIPGVFVSRIHLHFGSFRQELKRKLLLWAGSFATIVVLLMSFSADYASFFRNNKDIRQKANPVNFIYATIYYISHSNKSIVVTPMGEDAKINSIGAALTKPTLLVLVVGETARADHFSINGYDKPTTPLIAQQHIINYTDVYSCGTETAVSVPCMFSNLGRENYSDKKAKSQEGLLDVVKHSGISVLWRDNNSGCKGTCDRVDYEDMSNLQVPTLCNERECFDNILLHDIDKKIKSTKGTTLIVLHQKGSHGPDYYHRYPADMEVFSPVCKVNKLQDCSSEEINNAFDNTIHYTDQFLNKTIEWLKTQSATYNTAMIFLSDHGESLGEKNLYLHGMPYLIAPIEQKHIPFFFWFSEGFEQNNKINHSCLDNLTGNKYSQDNIFHTTLGLLNVSTMLYDPQLDMVKNCRE